jgi:hypothetical protein
MRWLESRQLRAQASDLIPVEHVHSREAELFPAAKEGTGLSVTHDVGRQDRLELKSQADMHCGNPTIPAFIHASLHDQKFISMCLGRFDALDVNGKHALAVTETFSLILELSLEQPVSVTYDDCIRFLDIFDPENEGVLRRCEFLCFLKFVWFMRWLDCRKQEATASSAATTAAGPADDGITLPDPITAAIDDGTSTSNDARGFKQPSYVVADFIQKTFQSEQAFSAMLLRKFDTIDANRKAGVLLPSEVFSLVLELSSQYPWDVTSDLCARCLELFTTSQKDVLTRDEICDFVKFVWFMRWLESKNEHDMAATDPATLESVPADDKIFTQQEDAFIATCHQKFDAVDVDRKGELSHSEIFRVVLELSVGQSVSVKYDDCIRLMAIFDSEKSSLSKDEVCDFVKFVWFMRRLESQEGPATLSQTSESAGPSRSEGKSARKQ